MLIIGFVSPTCSDAIIAVLDVMTTGVEARCVGSAPMGRVALKRAPSHPTASMGLCRPSAVHSTKLPRSALSRPHLWWLNSSAQTVTYITESSPCDWAVVSPLLNWPWALVSAAVCARLECARLEWG